jgi:uncharacterized protein
LRRTRLAVLTAFSTVFSLVPAISGLAVDPPEAVVFISEFHYDNVGADTNEAIEVQGPAGVSIDNWSLVLYNGSNSSVYTTTPLAGTFSDQTDGSGVMVVDYPSDGIQNGAPDGIALVDDTGTVVQFISYEGGLTGGGGPAAGLLATDVGVAETASTAPDQSLQRDPAGSWTGPACASFGQVNDPDAAETCPPEPVEGVRVNEVHYDNSGTDEGEAIEIYGPAGADLTGWSLVLYNGSNGTQYNTTAISGILPDLGGGFGVITSTYPTNGIQNGGPDGIALVDGSGELVEFLSYEGTFVAADGPAAGVTSTDIGVAQPGTGSPDQSLQRVDDTTWNGPACASFGQLNDPAAPIECPVVELPEVRFSEIHYDNAGVDANEALEIYGPAGTDLTEWSVVLYNGSGGGSYDSASLTGAIPDSGDGSGVVVVDTFSSIQNGAPDGFALVDETGTVIEFLSYEGVFTATSGPADGLISSDIGVAEGDSTTAEQSLQRDSDGEWAGPFCASFGEINDPSAAADCPSEPVNVFIHEVQGTGDTTPLGGDTVIIEGVVTSDFQTAEFLRGFNVQEEDTDADADPATSEGVFVFDPTEPTVTDVTIGDTVRVTGTAGEFSDQTQITASEIEILVDVDDELVDPGLVTTLTLEFPVEPGFDFEHIEGMLVNVPQDMYIGEYFNYDRFGEMVIAAERYLQPTAEFEPGSPEQLAALDEITRGRITLDDGKSAQNPEFLRHPNGGAFGGDDPASGLTNLWRGGDVLSDVTGVISPSFGWRIQPTQPADHTAANPRTSSHDDVGGRIEVTAFNVLNYFTTLDDGSLICGPLQNVDCRGANNSEELERQASKIVSALTEIDSDVVGVIEIENHPDDAAIQDLVDRLNAVAGAGTYDFVRNDDHDGKPVGTDAIRVGIIYQPATVTPVGSDIVLDDPSFLDPNSSGVDKNRAAQAQVFEENATGERFSVVVNHLKSKGSECGAGDDDLVNGQGNCNGTRAAAAGVLADWIDTDPYFETDGDVLIIGDLNSYDKEEPIDVLRADGYTDLIGDFQGEDAYSYLFDGQLGYLDYAMASPSMAAQVTGTTVWHLNADEADVLDYNIDFKGPVQTAIFEENQFRSSDHDPVIVGLDLDQTAPTVTADFDTVVATRHLGIFVVDFSCEDNVDPDPECVAELNDVPVEDGQIVVLLEAPGRPWAKEIFGVLNMKASDFELTVVGTDEAGNTTSETAEPSFR